MKESKTEKTEITEKKMFRLSKDDLMYVTGGFGPIIDDSTDDSDPDFGFGKYNPEYDYIDLNDVIAD